MSIPQNPKAMHGWMGYRHIPYPFGVPAFALAREIVQLKLPKKEFFEITHMVETIRDFIDPLQPIFDCCCGHGLTGMLLGTDERVPRVVLIDQALPPNRARLQHTLVGFCPSLEHRIEVVEMRLEAYPRFAPGAFVGVHACGFATDSIIEAAVRNRARFAIMTCCITGEVALRYGFKGVLGQEAAINQARLSVAEAAGYATAVRTIDVRITPWNSILLGWPKEAEQTPRGGLRESLLPARLPPRLAQADAARADAARAADSSSAQN